MWPNKFCIEYRAIIQSSEELGEVRLIHFAKLAWVKSLEKMATLFESIKKPVILFFILYLPSAADGSLQAFKSNEMEVFFFEVEKRDEMTTDALTMLLYSSLGHFTPMSCSQTRKVETWEKLGKPQKITSIKSFTFNWEIWIFLPKIYFLLIVFEF